MMMIICRIYFFIKEFRRYFYSFIFYRNMVLISNFRNKNYNEIPRIILNFSMAYMLTRSQGERCLRHTITMIYHMNIFSWLYMERDLNMLAAKEHNNLLDGICCFAHGTRCKYLRGLGRQELFL